ncbi:hypothetical protein V0M98_32585 (plasmid) [Pseudomonas silesiensis]|uniref:hypothetical protein n=1 Tax=Pseudomonas silesiensis TaxID=1853130 RepID=UPI0030CB055E
MNHLSDSELVAHALSSLANHVETGNLVLCAQDLQNQGKPCKALSEGQMELILRLRKLSRAEEIRPR